MTAALSLLNLFGAKCKKKCCEEIRRLKLKTDEKSSAVNSLYAYLSKDKLKT